MYWEKCNISYFISDSREYVKIYGLEVLNSQPYWVYISKEAFSNLQNKVPINISLKEYSLGVREFLLSGFASKKKSIFPFERENIQTSFVTNAVANSVVFYAMAYLNNKGLSSVEIKNLRLKYSLGNLKKRYFTKEELESSFLNQSAFFLNIYKEMNENDRFENFVDSLEQQEEFKNVFKGYNDAKSLKARYNRRIYHDKLECKFMRADYSEETYHRNTGVFSEAKVLKIQEYYSVDKTYLTELNMRLCKVCSQR